ncbi:MAG: phage tail protein [Desulfovibrio sp.]|jgi:hypothetical protein
MSGGGSSKKTTVGYRYYWGAQVVIAHAVDAVLGLRFGEQYGWTGEQDTSGRIHVSAASLFGGKGSQGGVSGAVDVCMGEADQPVNDYLASRISGPVSAARGVASLVFRSFYWGNNPYMRQIGVRVRRILRCGRGRGQWYPERAEVGAGDMNPAHIIRECLTDPDWGRGLPESLPDETAFRAAADTLFAEGFGLSVVWSCASGIDDFIQSILDCIDAVLFEDPESGGIGLRLLRDDYDADALIELGPDEIVRCEKFARPAWGATVTEVKVVWLDELNHERTVYERDQAAAAMQGNQVSETLRYPGISREELAQHVCGRELRQRTGNLAQVTLVCTRAAAGLRPGDVFAWIWPEYGIVRMALRVVRVGYGANAAGAVRLECVEDVFGAGQTLVSASGGSWWTSPVNAPQPVAHQLVLEAPYLHVVQDLTGENEVLLSGFGMESGALLVLAVRPVPDALAFRLLVDEGAGYVDVMPGEWSPGAALAVAASPWDEELHLAHGADLDDVAPGQLAFLGGGREGEIVLVQELAGSVLRVSRGVLDTVPAVHAAGERVFFDGGRNLPNREYALGEEPRIKVLTRTGRGLLDEAAAPEAHALMRGRAGRPYAPGRVRLNGEAWPETFAGDLELRWAHRNRVQQTAYVLTQEEGDVTPEAGTTYTVRVYGTGGALLREQDGIEGTDWTYTRGMEISDAGALQERLRVEILAVREGRESWQAQERSVARRGWGFLYDRAFNG